MVALNTVNASNARLKEAGEGLVALFLGGTSGIGQGVLKHFVRNAVSPRVYIVARNGAVGAALVQELRTLNAAGQYEIIEKNVSLLKDTEEVAEFVKAKETRLDLLFHSVGFFSFDGRQDTTEGLDATMTTRYYSRLRVTQLLLPLLNAAPSPHVVSVLAGGMEGPVNVADLALSDPKNFSLAATNNHTTTMLTLSLEHLAQENPRISFVHTFPGLVATPLLGRTSSGFLGMLFRGVVIPLLGLFATSADEAGARGLFYATSGRYSVDSGLVPLSEGLEKIQPSKGGVFLVNPKGEAADNEKVLQDFRDKGVDKQIWEHTMEVYAANK